MFVFFRGFAVHKAEEAGRSGCSCFGALVFLWAGCHARTGRLHPCMVPRRQLSAKVRKEGGYGRSDVAIFMGLLFRGIAVGAVRGD